MSATTPELDSVEQHDLQELQEIRARTMYRMVEEVHVKSHGDKRLLFLTNHQASLLATLKEG